jgi:hypothetical protein
VLLSGCIWLKRIWKGLEEVWRSLKKFEEVWRNLTKFGKIWRKWKMIFDS